MSAHQQQFAQIVRSAPEAPERRPQPVNTFMRTCTRCQAQTAHYRSGNQVQCAECGKITVRSEQGSALLEMVFWTAVVLFVLICLLGGRPW